MNDDRRQSTGDATLKAQVKLFDALARFRQWAATTYGLTRSGEWEEDYKNWDEIFDGVNSVLNIPVAEWSDDTKHLLIYAIARNNELESIARQLSDEQLTVLASISISSQEQDAKWQLAAQFGRRPHLVEGEGLLVRFAEDSDEYVRRRALSALADVGSRHTEKFAKLAWGTGEEYQQMASLHALWLINSSLLATYLLTALLDKRPYVSGLAKRMKNRTDEYAER